MEISQKLLRLRLPPFSQVKAISNQAGRVTFFEDGTIREENEMEIGGIRKTSHYSLSRKGIKRACLLKASENVRSTAIFLEIMKNEFGKKFSAYVKQQWTTERITHERPLNGAFIAKQIAQGEQMRKEKAAKKDRAISDNSEQPTRILDKAAKKFLFMATEETCKTCEELLSAMLQQKNRTAEDLLKLVASNTKIYLDTSRNFTETLFLNKEIITPSRVNLTLLLKKNISRFKSSDDIVNKAKHTINEFLIDHSSINGKSATQRRQRTLLTNSILQLLSPSILEAAHALLSTQEGFRGTPVFVLEECSIDFDICDDELGVTYFNAGMSDKLSFIPQEGSLPIKTPLPDMLEKNDLIVEAYTFGQALTNFYLAGSIPLPTTPTKFVEKDAPNFSIKFNITKLCLAYSPADSQSQAIINEQQEAQKKLKQDLSHLLNPSPIPSEQPQVLPEN